MPAGTTIRFTLSAAAKLVVTITRRTAGLRSGHRCLRPSARLRRAHAKRCARAISVGALSRAHEPNGADSMHFTGRIGPRALAPGPYGLASTNMWITDSYPPSLSFTKDDPAARPIGISPPDNGTKFRVVEFPPLDAATEAKMPPDFLMKTVGEKAPARGIRRRPGR